MLATLDGPAFIDRVSAHNPGAIRKAGAAIRRAFRCVVEDGLEAVVTLRNDSLGSDRGERRRRGNRRRRLDGRQPAMLGNAGASRPAR